MSDSRDASLSFSRDAACRAFGDPALASSPRRPFKDLARDPPSIDSRPATPYADILKEVFQTVHMPDLMVWGLPPPSSPWAVLPDDPQDNRSVALALDDHILQELLDAFKAPEPRTKLVKQNSATSAFHRYYSRTFSTSRRLHWRNKYWPPVTPEDPFLLPLSSTIARSSRPCTKLSWPLFVRADMLRYQCVSSLTLHRTGRPGM